MSTPANDGTSVVEIEDAAHVLIPWAKQGEYRGKEITRAEGVYFWDSDGTRYLDFTSQYVFANFGHGEQRVVNAIAAQASSLVEIAPPFVTTAKSRAATALSRLTPGDLNRVFFSTGGAEANEAAFKFARSATGRSLVCGRMPSYHGSTYGAMSLSENPGKWNFDPGVPGVLHVPVCNPYRCRLAPAADRCADCGEHCARELEQILLQYNPSRIAAIILEPIVGSTGGVIVPGDGYLQIVREICTRYGILLIADEVMTGFGRTGEWFACDHWGVVPDIMTMAKGITGGYVPMGATVVREDVAKHWDDIPLQHGHTYSGHTLGCAAITASIDVYETDGLVARSAEMGDYLLEKASELMERHPSVGDVRGKGLFTAVEMVRDRATKEPIGGADGKPIKAMLQAQAMQEGVYMFTGLSPSVLMFCPPLTVSREEIDEGMAVVDRVLAIADAEVAA